MSRKMALKFLRAGAIAALLCGGVGVGTWSFLWYQYRNSLPRSPQPASARVYPMNLRGVTVYATLRERCSLHIMGDVSLPLIGLGVVGGILTDPEYRRKMGWRNLDDPSR